MASMSHSICVYSKYVEITMSHSICVYSRYVEITMSHRICVDYICWPYFVSRRVCLTVYACIRDTISLTVYICVFDDYVSRHLLATVSHSMCVVYMLRGGYDE